MKSTSLQNTVVETAVIIHVFMLNISVTKILVQSFFPCILLFLRKVDLKKVFLLYSVCK